MEGNFFYSIKEIFETCPYTKRKSECLRKERNKILLTTDWCFLPDAVTDENKLNAIKICRQELRDFINRLLNNEIKCKIIDDDFEEKYFPKLIVDGTAQTQQEFLQ